jgi:hypothetical protein
VSLQEIEAIELCDLEGVNGLNASLVNGNIFDGLVNRLLQSTFPLESVTVSCLLEMLLSHTGWCGHVRSPQPVCPLDAFYLARLTLTGDVYMPSATLGGSFITKEEFQVGGWYMYDIDLYVVWSKHKHHTLKRRCGRLRNIRNLLYIARDQVSRSSSLCLTNPWLGTRW